MNSLRNKNSKVIVNGEGVKIIWNDYKEKLLNEEKYLGSGVTYDMKEGPECRLLY